MVEEVRSEVLPEKEREVISFDDEELKRKIFVVDGGFGFVKWLWGDRKGKIRSCYKRQGSRWIVGERALLEAGSDYLKTVDELIEMYPVFVRACERKAGIGMEDREVLVVGLPVSYLEEDVENGGKKIGRLKMELAGEGSYREVWVFPQGFGGIKLYLKKNPDVRGNVLGIDVGFNTVIMVLYSVEEKEILLSRTYYKKGVYDLVENFLRPRIRRWIGDRRLTPIELNYVIERKKIQIGLDVVDLSEVVEDAVREYVDYIFFSMVNDIRASFGIISFEDVVMMGGGAELMKDVVERRGWKRIKILDEPEYANVYGFRERVLELMGR